MVNLIVVGAYIEKDGKVFVCQRAPEKTYPGQWEFPGGKVEFGESLAAALQRELKEELSVEAQAHEILGTSEFQINADKAEFFLLRCELRGDVSPNLSMKDHSAHEWVDVKKLSELPMPPADVLALAQMYRRPSTEVPLGEVAVSANELLPHPKGTNSGKLRAGEFELKHLSVWSMAKIYGLLNGFVGLVMALGILWLGNIVSPEVQGLPRILTAVTLPFTALVMGGLAGICVAGVYNIAASLVGGVRWVLK